MKRMIMVLLLFATSCTTSAGAPGPSHVRISNSNGNVVSLVGDEPRLTVSGLHSNESTDLSIASTDAKSVRWTGKMTVRADSHGHVILDNAAVVSALVPSSESASVYYWDGEQDFTLTIAGASYTLRRRLVKYPVTSTPVIDNGLRGVFYRPALPGKRPAVIVLGGSDGGQPGSLYATVLAGRGYPVLALAYFKLPGLPQTLSRIPLEYFATALHWLAAQPGVDPNRLIIDGDSRGGEAALLIGSTYPTLVHGVIAAVPSNVAVCGYPDCSAGSAWTLHGKEVPYTSTVNQPAPSDNPNATIAVERINGPVLMTCGGNDQVWSSCPYAQAALQRLTHSRYPHHLILCQACDHFIGHTAPDEPRLPYPRELQYPANTEHAVTYFNSVLTFLRQLTEAVQ